MGDVHLMNNNNFNVLSTGSIESGPLFESPTANFFDSMKFMSIINDLKKKLAENQEHLKQLHQHRIKLSNYTIELEKKNHELQKSLQDVNSKREHDTLQLSFLIILCLINFSKQKFYNQLFANKIRTMKAEKSISNNNNHNNNNSMLIMSSNIDIFPEEEHSSDNDNGSIRGSGSVVDLRNLSSISLTSGAITVPNTSPPYSPSSSPRSASSTSSMRIVESPPAYLQFLSKNNSNSSDAMNNDEYEDVHQNIRRIQNNERDSNNKNNGGNGGNNKNNENENNNNEDDERISEERKMEELNKQIQFNLSLYSKKDRIPKQKKKRQYKTKLPELNSNNNNINNNNNEDDDISDMVDKLKEKLLLLQSILPTQEHEEEDEESNVHTFGLHDKQHGQLSSNIPPDEAFKRSNNTNSLYKSLSASSPQSPVFLPPLSPSKPDYLKHRRTNSRLIRALLDHDKLLYDTL